MHLPISYPPPPSPSLSREEEESSLRLGNLLIGNWQKGEREEEKGELLYGTVGLCYSALSLSLPFIELVR